MRDELKNMNGGAKQFWLRTHRKEVEDHYFREGPESTMAEFNMRQTTLERFLNRKNRDERMTKLSYADRWVLRVANEGINDLRRRIVILEEKMERVEPIAAIGQALVDATLIKIKPIVEKRTLPDNSLKLSELVKSRISER